MTCAIEKTEEALRRQTIRSRRRAIREGAASYAASPEVRRTMLEKMGVSTKWQQDTFLTRFLYGMVKNSKSLDGRKDWMSSPLRTVALLQCLGGEMIIEREAGL